MHNTHPDYLKPLVASMKMTDMLYSGKTESTPISSAAPAVLLTAENCDSSSRIRAFLRLSRIATDDTIRQHLNETPLNECDEYFSRKIAPQWRARSEVITFCSNYAKGMRQKIETQKSEVHNAVDLRIDPYALKDEIVRLEQQTSKCTAIENWTHNEARVETIIREQTASVLNDKCHYNDWLAAFRDVAR